VTDRHVAQSDCEEIRPGLIAQPANTVSSLAFVVAAVPIVRAARRRRRPAWLAVAAATAIEGIGSVAYHGPGGRRAKALHDAGLVLLAGALAVAVHHEGQPRRPRLLSTTLSVAAATLHAASRTGGPLCSCRSPLQGHAVFHVLAAAALTAAAEGR
jgi:peptidoglycan/LPS O-acetylase OafA/YrhL